MKRLIHLTILCFLSVSASGQVSFWTDGAHWSYHLEEIAPTNDEVQIRYWVDHDTLIQGVEAHVLQKEFRRINFEGNLFGPYLSEDYVGQAGDSILYFENGNWEVVMNFGVSQGDTVVLYFGESGEFDCLATDTMLIDSVYTTSYGGLQLKTVDYRVQIQDQLGEWFNPEWIPTGTYMERIGFLTDHPVVQPIGCQIGVLEHVAIPLECYTDTDIQNNGGEACDLVLSNEFGFNLESVKMTFSQDHIQIKNTPNSTLRIYDILGKQLYQASVNSDNQSFDISHLPNGILLVVIANEEFRLTKKVFKSSN